VKARLAFVLCMLAACGPASTPSPVKTEVDRGLVSVSSNTPLERFFPLVHGNLWHYDTRSDEGESGRLSVRARRTSVSGGELLSGTSARRIEFLNEGVGLAGLGVFVLKVPLVVGTSWMGEHGGKTRIEATDVSASVPAGRFEGCVVTIEERRGDSPVRYTTTFCPDVGIVVLDVEAGAAHERAELRSYGPPIDLGPAGSTFTDTNAR